MKRKRLFVDIQAAAGRKEYRAVLKKIIKDGICPFCPENFKYHTHPILRTGTHWFVTENMAPYPGTRHHFLFVLKKHKEDVSSLTTKEFAELLSHLRWLTKKYTLPAGSFFMRFGDTSYTNASVNHIHAQLILGSARSKKTTKLKVTLGHKKQ